MCRAAIAQDLFGGVQVVEGRNGGHGRFLKDGECLLERALSEARWALADEREVREQFAAATKQLTIFGDMEVARTLRNEATLAREAEDARKGLVTK